MMFHHHNLFNTLRVYATKNFKQKVQEILNIAKKLQNLKLNKQY